MADSKLRTASCECGALTVTTDGEPQSVVACHCIDCQRRSGSPFGLGAYYLAEQTRVAGEARTFTRPTDAGHQFVTHFCPTCGTSVYWYSGKNPGSIGIAVGCFADPDFPTPIRSVWERSKHRWVELPVQHHFTKGRTA
jgi:hypothetical protein